MDMGELDTLLGVEGTRLNSKHTAKYNGKAGEAPLLDGTRETYRNQGEELSDATTVPQNNVVMGILRSEDESNLIPGNAEATDTPVGAA